MVEWFKTYSIEPQLPDWRLKTFRDRTVLTVIAHVESQIKKFTGRVIETVGEAIMMGVTVDGPQDIADRVAATLRAVANTPENFFALLSHRTRCAVCNRPLADEVSKLVSVGPDCARRYRIPHSLDAAARRLELRHKLGL